MADLAIKKGLTLPFVEATLTYSSTGAPINLTGCTVMFRMRERSASTYKVEATATIVSATAGTVKYEWTATDTNTVGTYFSDWHILFPSGKTMCVPTALFNTIDIIDPLS